MHPILTGTSWLNRLAFQSPLYGEIKSSDPEHERVGKLVEKYKQGKAKYDLENSILSKKDQEIIDLKRKIEELELQLDHERERLAYAALVARQHNIDPAKFEQDSPLIAVKAHAKKEAKPQPV